MTKCAIIGTEEISRGNTNQAKSGRVVRKTVKRIRFRGEKSEIR